MSNKKVADLTTSGLEHTRAFVQSRIDEMQKYNLELDLQIIKDIDKELAKRASKINCSTCDAECDAPDPCPH